MSSLVLYLPRLRRAVSRRVDSGRLLKRIRWDVGKTDRIQMIMISSWAMIKVAEQLRGYREYTRSFPGYYQVMPNIVLESTHFRGCESASVPCVLLSLPLRSHIGFCFRSPQSREVIVEERESYIKKDAVPPRREGFLG